MRGRGEQHTKKSKVNPEEQQVRRDWERLRRRLKASSDLDGLTAQFGWLAVSILPSSNDVWPPLLRMADKERSLSTWQDLEKSRPLPVKFALYASPRINRALCPCLIVEHEDITVIRILDPEHNQPYISLCSIFALAGKSIPFGLSQFDLRREAGDYDLTLAGLEPREGIWAPLQIARRIAEELDLLQALGTLLDWEIRHMWSLDEGKEGLVHNWRAPQLDIASYSTKLLLQGQILGVELLSRGELVHTLISQEQREKALQTPVTIIRAKKEEAVYSRARSKFEQRLIRWSVFAYEALLQSKTTLQRAQSLEQDQRNDRNEDDDDGRLHQETFSIQNANWLTLLQDLLASLHADASFPPVSFSAEEMHTLTLPDAGLSGSSTPEGVTKQDIYRDARICITLLHQYWLLYRNINTIPSAALAASPVEPGASVPGQDEVKQRLSRLEEASKRTEWGIAELLAARKASPSLQDKDRNEPGASLQAPLLALTDVRFLLALLVGIVLGTIINRA